MKKYIKLIIPNAIAIVLNLLSYLCIYINADKIGLGAVGAAMNIIFFFGIYLVLYGIVSCVKTKSVIYPNLILLAFIVVNSILFCALMIGYVYLFELASIILISLTLSLIPSLLTKLIMLIADKCGKAKQADDTAAITKG